ncbi:MAG: hypothetical protein M1825_002778 [Sarcosagium campestre]|nr:MAG: hypothetical protein M1825_002778 [Sarcosagium campestre]
MNSTFGTSIQRGLFRGLQRSTKNVKPRLQQTNNIPASSFSAASRCLHAPARTRARQVSQILRSTRFKRLNSTTPNPTPNLGSPQPLSLSQRLRKLSREYGWSALGVYLLLSALDFPFCFLAVRTIGTDKIGHWEHVALDWFWSVVPWPSSEAVGNDQEDGALGKGTRKTEEVGDIGWGVEEAEKNNQGNNASIWTQLALAYAIHKSFIFIRVPLTAAVTPKVVKVLRGWGWDIGKRRPKPPKP